MHDEIVVHPCASQTDRECFPCLAVEVRRSDSTVQKTWVDLRKLGQRFDTLDHALAAARQVRVISVSEAGDVRWEWQEN